MRAVREYDLKGNLIKEYKRLSTAAKLNNRGASVIWKCCNGKSYTVDDRIFLYAEDSIKQRLDLINGKQEQPQRIVGYKQLVVLDYSTCTVHFHKIDAGAKVDERYLERCFGYKPSQCAWMIADEVSLRYHDYFKMGLN